jgi:prepilin-type N-terminal cleavage/methylation domain-containing protein
VAGRPPGIRPSPPAARGAAFTLIEIMVAIGIVAIILTIAIPSVYQQMHKDSMRQAVSDVTEACSQARARAVLDGVVAELKIRPGDRTISVVAGSAPQNSSGSFAIDPGEAVEHRGGGAAVFTAKFSDHIIIEFIGVNLLPDLHLDEEVSCFFYPNGTSDELVVLLRSDQGEIRKITTEVVTGIADVEAVR